MQVNRLFKIIYILLDQKIVSAKVLSERLEVSVRTIYRDVENLSEAGIPIYMKKGRGGGITLLPGFKLDKTLLTDVEKKEMLSAVKMMTQLSPGEAEGAMQKLESFFGKATVDWIEVDFSGWGDASEEERLFLFLKKSILEKCQIEFDYFGANGKVTRRQVEPLKLGFKGQAWYLYGFCHKREAYRFFKLSRIKSPVSLKKAVSLNIPTKIFKENYQYTDQMVCLKLKIASELAYRVYDEFTHFHRMADGSFQVSLELPENEWIYGYILSFGDGCEVLEPDAVRKTIEMRLKKALAKYDS